VRWHERHPIDDPAQVTRSEDPDTVAAGGPHVGQFTFVLGVLTTVLITVASVTNLFAKPLVTPFGGGVTIVGQLIVTATYCLGRRRGQPFVFPQVARQNYPVLFLSRSAGLVHQRWCWRSCRKLYRERRRTRMFRRGLSLCFFSAQSPWYTAWPRAGGDRGIAGRQSHSMRLASGS